MSETVSGHEEVQVLEPQRGWKLWLWWVLATALGEFVGFAVPAAVGAVAAWALEGKAGTFANITMLGIMVSAGLAEGAVLGFAQGTVLRRYIPNMARREWVVATALAAGLAWTIGMIPSTLRDLTAINPAILVFGGILLGAIFVASIGFAQWLILRRYIQKAGWWVLANALAWPLGVAVPFGGIAMVPDGAPAVAYIVVGVVSGLMMGVVVGAITGMALVWLLRTLPSRKAGY